MGEYDLLAVERHDLESGACATVADFLGVKTTSASRQIIYNTLDQCRLAAAGTAGEQNLFGHNARLWQCGQNHAVRPPIFDDLSLRPQRGHFPPLPRCGSSHDFGI